MLRLFSRGAFALALAIALLSIGCGSGVRTTKVGGKVTYKGDPVVAGDLNLYAKTTGTGAVAKIDPSGNYAFADALPPGLYSVFITSPPPEPVAPGSARAPKSSVSIPKKYSSQQTSTFTLEVKDGVANYPIELTD